MIHIHDTIITQRTQMQLEFFLKRVFFFLNLKLRVSICERMWADRRLSRMEASEAPATLRVRNTEVLHDQDPASPLGLSRVQYTEPLVTAYHSVLKHETKSKQHNETLQPL